MTTKKTKWPKLPSYNIPLFQNACIYLCTSKEEWAQAETSIGIPPSDLSSSLGRCRQFVNEATGDNVYLIGVFDGSLATLVHECAHATFYCCDDVGVTVDTGKANETYCYLIDRMFCHFMPHINSEEKP